MSLPAAPATKTVFDTTTVFDSARRAREERIGRIDFTVATLDEAVDQVLADAVSDGRSTGWSIRLAGAHAVVTAEEDAAYAEILNGPGATYADGAPIEWIMKHRRVPGAGRVRGPSLFRECLRRGQDLGVRHFLLGTTEETLASLTAEISNCYPAAKIAGHWAPPFGPIDDAFVTAAVEQIADTGPHLIWVAVGAPKQEVAALRLAEATGAICIGVGAAFDFVAKTKPEAPGWMQTAGVEWLFRLASEPRRLAHRYLVGNAQFLRIVARS
ncbi:WecB/TagA/CpsF family glycosyltransferase [Branchiibius sp. NY16-3462-2]|uniref:WecB/TagA/CpsF family glycosyltransferase n=1 Tax=Branchiibius sp. NY16-3462-2 TaxID=1807500 RepID=UPI0025B92D3D|nr:WecB/TagA/CpsF family glycosyltransferase [Branchiibius sp. NY16-3462-2]